MESQPQGLIRLEGIKRQLAECKSLDEVLDIRDKAIAAKAYCDAACLGLDISNQATELRIESECKAGELLKKMAAEGKRRVRGESSSSSLQLGDLGITKTQSSRWQQLAAVPKAKRIEHYARVMEAKRELTAASVRKLAARQIDPIPHAAPAPVSVNGICYDLTQLDGPFGTIYADPPWKYGNQSTRAATDNHYPTMSVDELCEMPIERLAAPDAHLHLWTTNAFLRDSFRVMEAWGFEYRSCFVWVKPQMGIGNYWRVSHEFLMLGIRGDAKRFNNRNCKSWGEYDRTRHSSKPDAIRSIIENVSPGPYLELFGRAPVSNWTVYGNQIDTQRLFA